MELKPGDVVMLKSGGHPITVVEVDEDKVECLWMGTDGDLFRETLPLVALESAEIDPEDDEQDDEEEDDENVATEHRANVSRVSNPCEPSGTG